MRRADRLFQIIQVLRRSDRPVTAQELAEELETSARTIYRDVADLIGQRVPIRGEAGIGYVLEAGFDFPPLMLSPVELEAAYLGAQLVAQRGEPDLAVAARDLLAKITAVLPEHLRTIVLEPTMVVPGFGLAEPDAPNLREIRESIRARRKIWLAYQDQAGQITSRIVWPLTIAYFQSVRLLVAWCELRQSFRHFRIDRISEMRFLEQTHPQTFHGLWAIWRAQEGANCLAL